MINLGILVVGLLVYFTMSKKVGVKEVAIVIGAYLLIEVILGMGLFLSSVPFMQFIIALAYVIFVQWILFEYKNKFTWVIYTVVYMMCIYIIPKVFIDMGTYEIGVNADLGYVVSMVACLIVGLFNILDTKINILGVVKYVLIVLLIGIYGLNSYVYNEYYNAELPDDLEVISLSTCEDLSSITSGNSYEIVDDIDCKGETVSVSNSFLPYKINIEGNGHYIRNMNIEGNSKFKINGKSSISGINFDGLNIEGNGIVGVNYGTISKVSIANSTVSGVSNVGGIVGINYGHIDNSYSAGNEVSGSGRNIGGIVGTNYGNIKNTYSTSEVTGEEYVGGIVGFQPNLGTLEYSFYDNISGNNKPLGGLKVVGQDKESIEGVSKFEEALDQGQNIEEYYNNLTKEEQYQIDRAYSYSDFGNIGINNIIVLDNEEYDKYKKVKETVTYDEWRKYEDKEIQISKFNILLPIRNNIANKESYERPISVDSIKAFPYNDYENEVYGIYDSRYLNGIMGFSSDTWDYTSLTEDSIGTSEPIKLIGM